MKLLKLDPHLLVLSLAALVFFAAGASRVLRSSNDFVPVYTGARCLLHGCNPYDTAQLEQQFFQAGGRVAELPSWDIDVPVYPPSTFLVLSPLALLRFPVARSLWFLFNGCLFVTSAALVLFMCPRRHWWTATALVSLFLVASGILLVLGQPAILAISLVVIGTYLFLRDRWLPLGSLLFALSLAVKPQIGGLIVLYLLVQRIHWRYAAAALAGALALLVGAGLILRENPRSADWPSSLRGNLSATLSPGGSADPRPPNQQAIGDINLQALTSIISSDAHTFNPVAYALFLALLAAWVIAVQHAERGPQIHFLSLGALSILSLMPVYHRFYDTRMLLLTIPAVVLVVQRRRLLGAVIAILTVLTIVSVQYRVQIFLLQHAQFQTILQNKFLFILLLRQQNLELLALFGLYLVAILTTRFASALTSESYPAMSR